MIKYVTQNNHDLAFLPSRVLVSGDDFPTFRLTWHELRRLDKVVEKVSRMLKVGKEPNKHFTIYEAGEVFVRHRVVYYQFTVSNVIYALPLATKFGFPLRVVYTGIFKELRELSRVMRSPFTSFVNGWYPLTKYTNVPESPSMVFELKTVFGASYLGLTNDDLNFHRPKSEVLVGFYRCYLYREPIASEHVTFSSLTKLGVDYEG